MTQPLDSMDKHYLVLVNTLGVSFKKFKNKRCAELVEVACEGALNRSLLA